MSELPPDTLNEIGVLRRREIEARILMPVLKALGAEFGDEPLDTEWSGTAYENLASSAQYRMSWEDFHAAVRATLVK